MKWVPCSSWLPICHLWNDPPPPSPHTHTHSCNNCTFVGELFTDSRIDQSVRKDPASVRPAAWQDSIYCRHAHYTTVSAVSSGQWRLWCWGSLLAPWMTCCTWQQPLCGEPDFPSEWAGDHDTDLIGVNCRTALRSLPVALWMSLHTHNTHTVLRHLLVLVVLPIIIIIILNNCSYNNPKQELLPVF